MSIFIITPAYEGRVTSEYHLSVLNIIRQCWAKGIEVDTYISNGGSLITKERNNLLTVFYTSGFSHCLMIDADTALVETERVLKWHDSEHECIAAASPTRPHAGFEFHLTLAQDKKSKPISVGEYYKLDKIGAAYMMITAKAVQKLRNKNIQRKYTDKKHGTVYDLFSSERIGETYYGEDYMFCKHLTDANIPILLDPDCTIIHSGSARNVGNFAKHTGGGK